MAVLVEISGGGHMDLAELVVLPNITLMPLPPVPGAQPGREHLAVHAQQLAVEPHLQILQ
jgi:hypothetical protein